MRKNEIKCVKDRLYYYFAEKNWGVRREYGPYVESHKEEHKNQRWKHWMLLIKLNWHYRVKRRKDLYILNLDKKKNRPCIEGVESALSNRQQEIHLARNLLQYDVISFDVFDTLILRPFSNPADLFILVGKKLGQMEFEKIRKDAEKDARDKAQILKGSREITLEEIYAIVEEKTGIPKEVGMQTEFEIELQYCFANPYMKRVYQLIQDYDKPIIFVSDMYLPYALMARLLRKNGYSEYEKLYISCEFGCTKRSGDLYKCVQQDYQDKKIIHIGDNHTVDIKMAEQCGLHAIFYKSVNAIGQKYRADGMSTLVGSAYRGLINAHLHNGVQTYSPYYEYGFLYGGLYVLGYCSWIHRKAVQEGIEKILFLSRDGAIYQKVFNLLFSDISNEYFLWSRMANTRYAFDKNKYFFFKRILETRVEISPQITVVELLTSLSLSEFAQFLGNYNLSSEVLFTKDTLESVKKMFNDHWNEIKEYYNDEKFALYEYIEQKIEGKRHVALIDVGWTAASTTGLKYLIEEEMGLDCDVSIWLAAATQFGNLPELMDGTISAYLFSPFFNTNCLNRHQKMKVGNHFFELFTQDVTPSFQGFTKGGKMLFALPEIENYQVIKEIHKGIFDFCKLYKKHFECEAYLFNISGNDAYQPYRFIGENPQYFEKYFSDILIARAVGCNEAAVAGQKAKEDKTIARFFG